MLYGILETLQEVLDRDLSTQERDQILQKLSALKEENHIPAYLVLIEGLQKILCKEKLLLVPHQPDFFERSVLRVQEWENKLLSRKTFRAVLILGAVLWGFYAIAYPLLSLHFSLHRVPLPKIVQQLVNNQLLTDFGIQGLLYFRVYSEVSVGIVLLFAAILFLLKKDKVAVLIAVAALLFSLGVVYLLVFYYDQLSALLYVFVQLLLFLGFIRYRLRFLQSST